MAAGTVWLVLRYAAPLRLVQAPNARSSHLRPTPAGGGIGIVLGSIVGALPLLGALPSFAAPILLAALALALLGLCDDVRPLPPIFRLLLQFAIVGAAVAWLYPGPGAIAPGFAILAIVGWVAWLNLFNFMDGIDGLAGSEALFLVLAPPVLACLGRPEIAASPLAAICFVIAAAVLGFLVFNWQPARIFMGDVGSMFLGWTTGAVLLAALLAGWLSPWQAAILPACFLTDGGLTLLRRAMRREPVWVAHRRHAYQQLSRRLGSHRSVVLGIIAIDLFWLLPLAMVLPALPAMWQPGLVALAYLPLIAFAFLAGAGRPEHA